MKAPHFDLQGVDGKRHSPASARGKNGLVVMFICNHCPYVKRSLEQILRDSRELAKQGIGSIARCCRTSTSILSRWIEAMRAANSPPRPLNSVTSSPSRKRSTRIA